MEQPTSIITGEPYLADCYVISNGYDFTDLVCKEHAEDFAIDADLHWSDGHTWTDQRDDGATAYRLESYESNEADSPVSCGECHVYLECTLTPDGVAYVQERGDFPKWLTDILIPESRDQEE